MAADDHHKVTGTSPWRYARAEWATKAKALKLVIQSEMLESHQGTRFPAAK